MCFLFTFFFVWMDGGVGSEAFFLRDGMGGMAFGDEGGVLLDGGAPTEERGRCIIGVLNSPLAIGFSPLRATNCAA